MPVKDLLLCLLIPLVWGAAFTLAKPASEHFPPLAMLAAIYAFCALVFGIGAGWRQHTPPLRAFAIAMAAGAGQALLLFIGLAGIDASIAVLLVQIQVPLAVLASAWINGERIDATRMLGIAIAFAGVAAVAGLPAVPPPVIPVMLILVGAAVWAVGQALMKRWSRDPAAGSFRMVSLWSWPVLAVASLALERGQVAAITSASPAEWASLAGLTLGGYAVGNTLWYTMLKRRRVDEVSPFLLLMPVIGVVAGAMILGESIGPSVLTGGALILTGLAICTGLPGRRNPEQPQAPIPSKTS